MSYITWGVVGVLLVYTNTCDSQVWCRYSECPRNSGCWFHSSGLWYCVCKDGYRLNATGQCVDIDECSWDVCRSRGRCSNSPGFYQCADECDRGLARTCTDIDECEFPVCGPDGDCVNSEGSYRCGFIPGYHFINGSRLDIDECNWNPCGSFQCRNFPGGYDCQDDLCRSGFSIQESISCTDIDECNWNPCGSLACTNFAGGYDCQNDGCFPGLTRQYQNDCADIDECNWNPCGSFGCNNFAGGYDCQNDGCFHGLTKQYQSVCADIDECELDICGPNSNCTNVWRSYLCQCLPGYQVRNSSCSDVDECMVHHPCHPNADCTNLPETYNCTCKDGFFGNGTHCEAALPSSAPANSASVAVGVVFGCIFLVLAVLLVLFMIRRRQRQKATTPSTPHNHTTSGQPEDPDLYSNNLVKERKILMKQLKQSEQENLPDAPGGVYENQPTIIQDGGSSYDTLWKSVGSGQPFPDNPHTGNDDTYNHLHSQAVRSTASTEETTPADLYNHLYSRTSA